MVSSRQFLVITEAGASCSKAPAGDAGVSASIDVSAWAMNVDRAVSRTAATQRLAGRPQKSAAVDRRVRLLAIAPVVSRMADQSREADRQLHQHGFGFAARLDQRNRDAGSFAEAGGEARPRPACSDADVVHLRGIYRRYPHRRNPQRKAGVWGEGG